MSLSLSVITTMAASHCNSCSRCECVIPNIITVSCRVLHAFVFMCLCALELFFACRRPECKFLEKYVRADIKKRFTVLSFTVENNTPNIIKNMVNRETFH